MDLVPHLVFGPFRFDPINKHLWRGEEQLALRPMAGAVLLTLAERAGEVVTKEELLKRVWAGTCVTDTVLRVCIREIRQTLEDSTRTPRYIETVGRQGYRFVGNTSGGKPLCPSLSGADETEPFVGRTQEVARLQQWFLRAERGERQIVFVTGEPGIGKTTIVDLFLARVRATGLIRIGYGQCLEHYGKGEAYLPILEVFVRLSRELGGSRLLALLNRYAPTWLMQMPALLSDEDFAHLQSRSQGTTQQRMLREMAEALEVLTAERPFVLVLEDLHWSDFSTIELISYLAQRQERARLMVVGTYRPSDIATGHPLKTLKQELQLRSRWKELSIDLLTEQEVATYVAKQFPEHAGSGTLANAIYQRTEGNPLFMVNVANALADQDLRGRGHGHGDTPLDSKKLSIPENLQQTIEQRFERLHPHEQDVLEAASVAGTEFTAAVVAAAAGKNPIEVEERCRELVRRKQFLQAKGTAEWPDGTVTERYRFIHALYQEVLHAQVTGGKRVQLHLRIAERIEQGHRNRKQEVATELALHFEQGRDFPRTVQYLGHAAENANRRCAYPEAIRHLGKALDLLKLFPNNPERAQREIMLQIALGMSLMATKGYAAPEVKLAYDRARELCLQVGETPQLVSVLRGLAAFYYVRAEWKTARELVEQILNLVQRQENPVLVLETSQEAGGMLFSLGEFVEARNRFQQSILLYDPQIHRGHTALSGQDLGVSGFSRTSHALWFLGYPDQALSKSQEALSLSRELTLPHSLAYALTFAAGLSMFCREWRVAQQYAEEARRIATDHEFPIWATMGQILGGWALVHQGMAEEGMIQIQDGLTAWRTIGAQISVPYFLSLLAEAYSRSGQLKKGLLALTEALTLTNNTEERWWEAELYRLRGELLLKEPAKNLKLAILSSPQLLKPPHSLQNGEAEDCFHTALEIARRQQTKSLELRAATSFARLKQQQGKSVEAHHILEEVYNWFTEGFSTADLQEAKGLLDELREQRISEPLSALRRAKAGRKTAGTRQSSPDSGVAQSVQG